MNIPKAGNIKSVDPYRIMTEEAQKPASTYAAKQPPSASDVLWQLAVITVFCVPLGWLFYSCSTYTPKPSQERLTVENCRTYARSLATHPSTATFSLGRVTHQDRKYVGSMTSQNILGVPTTRNFECWTTDTGGVLSFDFK